jgi:hypothetical protein
VPAQEPPGDEKEECAKCYPGSIAIVPPADMTMAALGIGLTNVVQMKSEGGTSLTLFGILPMLELAIPKYRVVSVYYGPLFGAWVGSASGKSESDFVVSQHRAGFKLVPYFDGKGDGFAINLGTSVLNSSVTNTTGADYVRPEGLFVFGTLSDPVIFKAGLGGYGQVDAKGGSNNSGGVGWTGQFGGRVVKREAMHTYIVMELAGQIDIYKKTTYTYSSSPSSGSGSSGSSVTPRTSQSTDFRHNMDLFFGVIARSDHGHLKLGFDLPLSNRSERVDFGLVLGAGALW